MYFVTSLPVAVIAFAFMGLSTILFVPAQQAFLGDNVPYAQHGRVMAIAEFAWSMAAIIGLPLVGILVQANGWRAGFVAIGIFSLGGVGVGVVCAPKRRTYSSKRLRARYAGRIETHCAHQWQWRRLPQRFCWRQRMRILMSFLAPG